MGGYAGFAGEGNGKERHGHTSRPSLTRVFGYLVIAAVCGIAGVAVFAIGTGNFDDTDWRIVSSVAAVAVFSLTAMGGATLAQRNDSTAAPLGGATVLVSAGSLALALVYMWTTGWDDGGDYNVTLERAAGVGLTCSIALGHISLLLGWRRETDNAAITALVSAAIGFAVGIATLLVIAIVSPDLDIGDGYWRTVGVMAILGLMATILAPIVRRVGRSS
jgi:hypothetical protein